MIADYHVFACCLVAQSRRTTHASAAVTLSRHICIYYNS